MAAPKFTPVDPVEVTRGYSSPDHVPEPWFPARPADIDGRQPVGPRLGYPGPDQGYALTLAALVSPEVQVQAGESLDDALAGATAIALRRASLFGRAPVIHDLRVALAVWGFLDNDPPADLLAARRERFVGLRDPAHHYEQLRALVDVVPESTLRSTPEHVRSSYRTDWRTLTGTG